MGRALIRPKCRASRVLPAAAAALVVVVAAVDLPLSLSSIHPSIQPFIHQSIHQSIWSLSVHSSMCRLTASLCSLHRRRLRRRDQGLLLYILRISQFRGGAAGSSSSRSSSFHICAKGTRPNRRATACEAALSALVL